MKGIITTGLLLASLPLSAMAGDCTGGSGTQLDATNTLLGKTVCASATNGDSWQEWHKATTLASGQLIEYALGPTDPIDPTHTVGTWTRSGSSITYNYTGGGSYTFELWEAGGTRYFCPSGSGTTLVATVSTILSGQQPCP
jgi:hypothetical protein